MRRRLISTLSNERGYTLLLAIFAVVLFSILGMSIITISGTTLKTSSNERDDQAVYYIAEAGLVEVRASINEAAKSAYFTTLEEYNKITDPEEKASYDFQGNFLLYVDLNMNALYFNESNPTNKILSDLDYESQFNNEVFSEATVEFLSAGSDVRTYLITSMGTIGNKNRTVSQKVDVTLNAEVEDVEVIIEDKTDPYEVKACYALYANGAITAGSGKINGDIYSNSKLVINNSGASFNGNVYSTEEIEIKGSQGIKNVYSPKSITITNGTITGSVYAGQNISISNGTVNGNLIAADSIMATNGTIEGDVISKKNVTISDANIKKDIIALNNIIVKKWANPNGDYRYGNSIFFEQNNNPPKEKQKPLNADEIKNISNQQIVILDENGDVINSCTSEIPILPEISTTFISKDGVDIAPNDQIYNSDSKNYIDVIKNGNLEISHYKTADYTLDLSRDMYFKNIDVDGYKTLYIDLKGEERTIFVDSLNVSGHIKLKNPGKLNIHVIDSFKYSGGSLNADGSTPYNVSIYYSGKNSIQFASDLNINSNLYVKNADVTFTGGGRVKGNVFVYGNNQIKVSGGSSVTEQLFLAPNSELIHNNGSIKGNVVTKNYEMSGGASVIPPEKDGGSTNPGGGKKVTVIVKEYQPAEPSDYFLNVYSQLEE